jgi:hypothetical protein
VCSNPRLREWTPYTVPVGGSDACAGGRALFTPLNSTSEMRPFEPDAHEFWSRIIPVVESLTLNNDYQFYNPLVDWRGVDAFT